MSCRLAVVLVLLSWAAQASAEEPVLVELFTSQGCSSCPPADRYLGDLSERDDVVALAFHVDYWNDLGWADPYSSPRWTARQQGYGFRVYTPQMVVAGSDHAVGSRPRDVRAKIAQARAKLRGSVRGTYRRTGSRVLVEARVDGVRGTLFAALFEKRANTAVAKGENAGRTLKEVHIVRELVELGQVDGQTGAANGRLSAPRGLGSQIGVAVFVQAKGSKTIPAAAYAQPRP